jgi:hypothetical protein
MDLFGAQQGDPGRAVVAGDVRANENIALTAIQTLFVREHNRIVDLLPVALGSEVRFQTARRIVGAEIQRITYEEFLPAVGVVLSRYRGYQSTVNPGVSNEFATTGFRAHSMVHGEFAVAFEPGTYTDAQLASFTAQGIEVDADELAIPLTVAFGNPALLEQIGLAPMLLALGAERQYRNDEQIDNTMRSVLFEVPGPDSTDPAACQVPVIDPACFTGVVDLGALDLERAHDHGIPNYNALRKAYGLRAMTSFTSITGEAGDAFPTDDPLISTTDPINDPDIMTFTELRDAGGVVLDPADPDTAEDAVTGTRATTLAARLKAIYRNVNDVDAFTGMVSEPHQPGKELGELQAAIWRRQFTATRDGDRSFYVADPVIALIKRRYGISLSTLSQIIEHDAASAAATPFDALD